MPHYQLIESATFTGATRRLLATLGVAASLWSCAGKKKDSVLAIHGGKEVIPESALDKHTVSLLQGEVFVCTAVLVSKDVAVTAKHCVDQSLKPGSPPLAVQFASKKIPEAKQTRAKVVDIFTLDAGKPFVSLARDLAAVRFAGRIPGTHAPVKILRNLAGLSTSDELISVGMGQTAEQCVKDVCYGKKKQLPLRLKNLLGLSRSRYFLVAEAARGGVCSGDSGGPLLVKKGESFKLVAIHSGSDPRLTPGNLSWDGWNCERGEIVTVPIAPYLTELEAWMGESTAQDENDPLALPPITAPGTSSLSSFARYCDSDDLPWEEGAALDSALLKLNTFNCVEAERLLREGGELRVTTPFPALTILKHTPWIKKLSLRAARIGDTPESISALENLRELTDLESLDLRYNGNFWNERTIEIIRSMRRIKHLYLASTYYPKIFVNRLAYMLQPLAELETLSLPDSDGSFPLDALSHLRFLETLEINSLQFDEPRAPLSLPSVKRLDAEQSTFADLDRLAAHFPNLEVLDISDNSRLVSLDALVKFPYLRALRYALGDWHIDETLPPLLWPNLPGLELLVVESQRTDLSELTALAPSLRQLTLLSPGERNLKALLQNPTAMLPQALVNLNVFRGFETSVQPELPVFKDLKTFGHLSSLTDLTVQFGRLGSLNGIEAFPLLERANFQANGLHRLDQLGGATNLVELDMSSNPIEDLSPLASLTKLERARLDSARVSSRKCPLNVQHDSPPRCSFLRGPDMEVSGDYRFREWIYSVQ